jgi:hypothetical protein
MTSVYRSILGDWYDSCSKWSLVKSMAKSLFMDQDRLLVHIHRDIVYSRYRMCPSLSLPGLLFPSGSMQDVAEI